MSREKVSRKLLTYQAGIPRKRGEGLRVGAVRFLPRGVRKEDYARLDYFDVWLQILAPSQKLLGWLREREWTPQIGKQFFDRYKRELLNSTDSRQVIQMLSELSKRTPISIGCYCEDETRCHRHILYQVIQAAGK